VDVRCVMIGCAVIGCAVNGCFVIMWGQRQLWLECMLGNRYTSY
jgi:hypothetical protein